MNLRKQLLLVSLLTLVLPWAGYQFIRETESALRNGQQQMLSGTAQAIADSLSQFPNEFLPGNSDSEAGRRGENQLYGHPLQTEPMVDGYFDDWSVAAESMRALRGGDGDVSIIAGSYRQYVYVFIDARDRDLRYSSAADDGERVQPVDFISIVSASNDGKNEYLDFLPEAPGTLIAKRRVDDQRVDETRISAHWLDTAGGYRLEARLPRRLLGERIGIIVNNATAGSQTVVRSSSFDGTAPGRFITASPVLESIAAGYAQPDVRLIITDMHGWRLAAVGSIATGETAPGGRPTGWTRIAYRALLEAGEEAALADPDASGREQQDYLNEALDDRAAWSWFRSENSGRAVIAVAQPIWSGTVQTGALILQQGTDAILSLTNAALSRLVAFTLIATLAAAAGLLGYASWLSMRIRNLSAAADDALEGDRVRTDLPSLRARDEIGDLSRSFSDVLRQLGDYNDYLRTLASKLSHELRTPLAIVTSSLENLDHEPLSETSANYTKRAKDGAARLQSILSSMSEASRVEELIENADTEEVDLSAAIAATIVAYRDAWPDRKFGFEKGDARYLVHGSPELLIQMLDKLVDNAVSFSSVDDQITIGLRCDSSRTYLTVSNPGPPLPGKMREGLFDSMISVRSDDGGRHLGLGLYIARLVATGHRGSISADNIEGGVEFRVTLPRLHH